MSKNQVVSRIVELDVNTVYEKQNFARYRRTRKFFNSDLKMKDLFALSYMSGRIYDIIDR